MGEHPFDGGRILNKNKNKNKNKNILTIVIIVSSYSGRGNSRAKIKPVFFSEKKMKKLARKKSEKK